MEKLNRTLWPNPIFKNKVLFKIHDYILYKILYSLNNDYDIAVGVLSTKDVKLYLACM